MSLKKIATTIFLLVTVLSTGVMILVSKADATALLEMQLNTWWSRNEWMNLITKISVWTSGKYKCNKTEVIQVFLELERNKAWVKLYHIYPDKPITSRASIGDSEVSWWIPGQYWLVLSHIHKNNHNHFPKIYSGARESTEGPSLLHSQNHHNKVPKYT